MADMPADPMRALHDALAADLLARFKEGNMTAAELNVARQFLKDNGIESLPVEGSTFEEFVQGMGDPAEIINLQDRIGSR